MGKVETVLQENRTLKEEMEKLVNLIKENEIKQKGFRLVEDSFLLSESFADIDQKALKYMQDIFDVTNVTLFVNKDAIIDDDKFASYENIKFVDEQILKYAYVEKRPYFGTYIEGLITEFKIIPGIASYLIAPILDNGRIIASLNLYSEHSERISSDGEPDFIKDLVLRIAITLRKLNETNKIIQLVKYDYMTEIYSKRMMNELLNASVKRFNENKEEFTFMLLDMDNFKSLNDRHGHIAGDEAIKFIASEIKKILKNKEAVGRFGGDEFYMILNDTTQASILKRFSEITKIVSIVAEKYHTKPKLGISAGYVCIPHDVNPEHGGNVTDILKMADLGLYKSKLSDRKLTCAAQL